LHVLLIVREDVRLPRFQIDLADRGEELGVVATRPPACRQAKRDRAALLQHLLGNEGLERLPLQNCRDPLISFASDVGFRVPTERTEKRPLRKHPRPVL
jgi:hypothetical protein